VFKAFRGGRGQREPVHALHSVSLSVCAGESVGLVGETGSGKTTLGRCVVGLERPDAGTITVDGIPSHALSALTRSQIERLRRTVQMVFQDPYSSLNPARTVGESLREALRRTDAPSRRHGPSVGALLERVGLPAAYERRKPAALSGGERQRVAIARAIAVRPQLVVCDEPVSALDVSVQAQILNLLADLREQLDLSLLFISHDLSVIRQVADRVYVLFRGEIVEDGPTDVVLDSPRHPYTRQLVEAVPRADGSWLQARPA
jgi:peptide/nickel transport system ATP-binding protein